MSDENVRGNNQFLSPRQYAKQNGYVAYPGKPCKNCGETERYTGSGSCVKCAKAETKRRVEAGDFRKYYKSQRVDPSTLIYRKEPEPVNGWQARGVGSSPASEQETYLVTQDGGPMCKIGVTARGCIDDRVRRLRVGSLFPLIVVGTIPGNQENELHEKFAQYRALGEWFITNDAIVNEFKPSEPTTT